MKKPPPCCLIVDDEPDIRELLGITLERMNIECVTAASISDAHACLKQRAFDLCLSDMRLPDGNGIDLVTHLQQYYPNLPVAIITAHGNMEYAISALKAGAFDFISKPVDLKNLRNIVSTALKHPQPISGKNEPKLIGSSPIIENLRKQIGKLARSQAPVYISGESGTGKELAARLIHLKGQRCDKAFVPVNCGAIPGELMESEFFGHKKGSFTGANTDKDGLFQAAQGGVLFLDEVADLPLSMQVKLLRAIQEKHIRPVGEQKEIPVDVRVLSATHKDLMKMVETGQFRQDLFYRINVIELSVPPLRERRSDIPDLVENILQRLAQHNQIELPVISAGAMSALKKYHFPGNIRELENILERAMTLCENGEIHTDDLQLPEHGAPFPEASAEALDPMLDNVEKETILNALDKTRWNKTKAAKLLGINIGALRYRLQKLGLDKK